MLKTVIKKGSYHDSVILMLLTNQISTIEGVNKVSIMMGTPANKDIYEQSGLATSELAEAGANDLVIVADVDDEALLGMIENEMEEFFKKQPTVSNGEKSAESVKSWDKALEKLPEANLAVISIPGEYAALEADRALDEGLNVFMFSDNVSIEDEKALKTKAHEKGLAVMGPDCGTGIIQGVPIAFTNNVEKGSIGIIGAVISRGFEIETEMSIHAADKNMFVENVVVDYKDRPEGSESKLNTYSDGFKVLRTIARLFRTYQPMKYFGSIAGVLAVLGGGFSIPVFKDYFVTGLVKRFPTLIVCCFVILTAIVSLFSGAILKTITWKNRQDFEMTRHQARNKKEELLKEAKEAE